MIFRYGICCTVESWDGEQAEGICRWNGGTHDVSQILEEEWHKRIGKVQLCMWMKTCRQMDRLAKNNPLYSCRGCLGILEKDESDG